MEIFGNFPSVNHPSLSKKLSQHHILLLIQYLPSPSIVVNCYMIPVMLLLATAGGYMNFRVNVTDVSGENEIAHVR